VSTLFRCLRSLLGVAAVGVLFFIGSPVLRLYALPVVYFHPERRFEMVSWFMKWMSRNISRLLVLGGARIRRTGRLPTTTPALVVANHQSLLDITQVTLLADPFVPAFVTRKRYGRFVPLVSASLRLLGAPLIDPKREPRRALVLIREAARTLPHGLIIFPEGHRTCDGEVQPFYASGLQLLLADYPWPVYVVVNEGTWRVRRLTDMLFNLPLMDAQSEVMGPFDPPRESSEIPAFVEHIRQRIVGRLREMRAAGLSDGAAGR
jgi:1-acyl-sn-glycerol-3-phosphate acyltransferase